MLKIGHRGAAGYEPENTLRSFQRALDMGVDMIELDIQVCASGEIVVIHDDDVERTTNGNGLVAQMTLKKLKKLDAGKGERIPLLSEVLDLVNRRAKVNVELKGRKTATPTAAIIKSYVVQKKWSYEDFLVTSFHWHELSDFSDACPEVKLGILLLALRLKQVQEIADSHGIQCININSKFAKKKIIDLIHKCNLDIMVWTVNEKSEIEKLRSLGVDGIFSDFPDRF